jgi:hypothetical protein
MLANIIDPALFARLEAAASEAFETPESYLMLVLNKSLPGRKLQRNGGKAPAAKLIRLVNPRTKRGKMLALLLHASGATVAGAMAAFGCSRESVFSYLTALHLRHGIGYAFDAASDSITVRLPEGVSTVFDPVVAS